MRQSVVRWVCWTMILIFPAVTVAAETPAATLRATGAVTVNGAPGGPSGTVFAGDLVATGAQAQAVLTANRTLVMLPADSAVVLGREQVKLHAGTAVISTSRQMAAQVRRLTVTPQAAQPTQFVVREQQGKVEVAALRGAVLVSDGSNTVPVAEGAALRFDSQTAAPSSSRGVPINHFVTGEEWAIIAAIAAAVAAGVIVGVVNRESASPSAP